jgi:hypothetical protein
MMMRARATRACSPWTASRQASPGWSARVCVFDCGSTLCKRHRARAVETGHVAAAQQAGQDQHTLPSCAAIGRTRPHLLLRRDQGGDLPTARLTPGVQVVLLARPSDGLKQPQRLGRVRVVEWMHVCVDRPCAAMHGQHTHKTRPQQQHMSMHKACAHTWLVSGAQRTSCTSTSSSSPRCLRCTMTPSGGERGCCRW